MFSYIRYSQIDGFKFVTTEFSFTYNSISNNNLNIGKKSIFKNYLLEQY